jgi:hypothetical protein
MILQQMRLMILKKIPKTRLFTFYFPICLSSYKCRKHVIMKITFKEGWTEKSKMAIFAIMASMIAIIVVIILD